MCPKSLLTVDMPIETLAAGRGRLRPVASRHGRSRPADREGLWVFLLLYRIDCAGDCWRVRLANC